MENKSNEKRTYRDVSKDVISNKTLEEVQISGNYGDENVLITRCLNKFPLNTDPDVVAMKMQGRIRLTPDRDFVKPQAHSKNSQRISAAELLSIPEIRAKYPGIEIVGGGECRPAEEEKGKNND